MKETFELMKKIFEGKWVGKGFAQFPTIISTAYSEQYEIVPDKSKDVIFFNGKAIYKNETVRNGQTVFWDGGFILLKENQLVLHSVQSGGRIEMLQLASVKEQTFTFRSTSIHNDPKTIQSERTFTIENDNLQYELNMATNTANFQNHLKASLKKVF